MLTKHVLFRFQGGAIAAVAAVYLAELNPYTITFGQPPTLEQPCDTITSERYYRFVNTKDSESLVGISYDPVPFAPGLGTDAFGHMILLSSDDSGVAYIGLDAQDKFGPLNVKAEAHSMLMAPDNTTTDPHPGYLDRVRAIRKTYEKEHNEELNYPIRTSGYKAGTLCSEDQECETGTCEKEVRLSYSRCVGIECKHNLDCATNRCDHGLCLPKAGSCADCNEDSDCASDHCLQYKCAGADSGLMDNECNCYLDSDCVSGRCEGLAPPVCEAVLSDGSSCNEDSDCASQHCSWRFHCTPRLGEGEYCTHGTACLSGQCSWWFKCTAPSVSKNSPRTKSKSSPRTKSRASIVEMPMESSTTLASITTSSTFTYPIALLALIAAVAGYARVQSHLRRRRRMEGYEVIQAIN